jgi:tripartite-type tricarboxylate transporter receptor subunit TctC
MFRQGLWSVAAAAAMTALGAIQPASSQDWPTRAISMVVPFGAGSASDTAGRIVGARMSELLGQQVVVENTPGAGG